MVSLTGKVAVITGASRGLGAGLARAFAARGLRLGLCSRAEPALSDGPHVVAARLDVTDEAALADLLARVEARLGPVDLWINNAAVLDPMGPLRDLPSDEVRRHLMVNVLGVVHGTQLYARHLRRLDRPGVLVNLSSGAARTAYAGWGPYCAGKAAVERLTEVVALEEGPRLRAHAVSPGIVDTDMQARIRRATADEFPQLPKFLDVKAREAFNTTEHVAASILALAFDPDDPRRGEVAVRVPPER